MKKNKIVFLLIIMVAGFISGFFPADLNAQGCPKGVRFDCVWGCGRHTDLNNDGFCDYSHLTKPDTAKVIHLPDTSERNPGHDNKDNLSGGSKSTSRGDTTKTNAKSASKATPTSSHGFPSDDGLQDHSVNDQGEGIPPGIPMITPPISQEFIPSPHEPVYHLIFVTVLTLLLYFTTLILYRENIITRIHHRKIWNLLLLITFLVSCLFGLFLVVQINYNIAMGAFKTLLYWHVEIGVAMTLIAIIHILWHLTYFKKMFQKRW